MDSLNYVECPHDFHTFLVLFMHETIPVNEFLLFRSKTRFPN